MYDSIRLMSGIFDIVYEDSSVLIVNKIAAVPVLPDKSGDTSLKDSLMALRPGHFFEAAHRLDRRTSGLVSFCKNRHSLADLSRAFHDRKTRKIYWAVVENEPPAPSGTLHHKLVHNKRNNTTKAYAVDDPRDGQDAMLNWETLGSSEHYWLLAIHPLTGRTHQIRAQLSAAGMPVRGDLKYGARRSSHNGLIMLHARELSFELPDGKKGLRTIKACAEPPDDEPLWQKFS